MRSEVVYITANVSETELLDDGVAVGDEMSYGGYINHPLEPGVFHIVGLRGVVAGATTPMYPDSAPSMAISKSIDLFIKSVFVCYST